MTLPEGKSWMKELVVGTNEYVDPIYHLMGILSEYSDGHLVFDTNILVHVKDLQQRGEAVEFGGDSN